jgi:hypothetical protein
MANFSEMAKAVAEAQALETSDKITEMKAQKDSANQMMTIAIAQEELKKNEQDAQKEQIKSQQKKAKIKGELLKTMAQNEAGPLAIGDDLVGQFAPPVESGAENLPLIDMNSQRI